MTRTPTFPTLELDCRGQQCPEPVLRVARAVADLDEGTFVRVRADDPAFPQDIQAWSRTADAKLVRFDERDGSYEAVLRIGEIQPSTPPPAPTASAPRVSTPPASAPRVSAPRVSAPRVSAPRVPAPPAASAPPASAPVWAPACSAAPPAPAKPEPERKTIGYDRGSSPTVAVHQTFDMRGRVCPTPIVALAQACTRAHRGARIRVYADDPGFPADLRGWIAGVDAQIISLASCGDEFEAVVQVGNPASVHAPPHMTASLMASRAARNNQQPAASSPAAVTSVIARREDAPQNRCTLLVLHNDHEALLAALLVANGAAAQGMKTNVFFTFWGLNLLRADCPNLMEPDQRIGILQRLMKWMMPKGPKRQPLGQMHFAGMGKGMLEHIMRQQRIMMLPDLLHSAQELGVRFTACTMSMSVMGITRRDLYPYPNLDYGGVAAFVADARQAGLNLVF